MGLFLPIIKNSKESVFSAQPAGAYLIGGRFYALPNDSLEKIAEYARKTGVRWLAVVEPNVRNHYTKVNWLQNISLENDYSELLALHCKAEGRMIYLYEFKKIKE